MAQSGKTQTHEWVVDEIEESMASIEVDGDRMITVPQGVLPAGVRQGHVLRVQRTHSADGKQSTVTIEIDDAATRRALAESAAQVKKGSRQPDDPGGDITL